MQTLSLLKALKLCGHNVEVLCYFEYENRVVEEFRKAGGNVRLLNLNRGISFFELTNKLIKEIREINPDVVHVQYMAPGALPIFASRLAGVKNVFATVHQPNTKAHGRFAKPILRAASLLTTTFIAVSLNAEESWFGSASLYDELMVPNKPLRHFTIYNSLDSESITRLIASVNIDLLKRKLSIPLDNVVIGAISRLRHEKGIDVLIEAFYLLIKEDVSAHLLLVGTGPDAQRLKEKVMNYGLSSKVTFLGEADWDKAMQLLSLMDIVVVPSRFEGFGLTAAEAMAAGKPVVASDTSGLKEVVANGKTGILFPIDDYSILLKVLHKLIRDRDLRLELGAEGSIRVSENFSFEIFTRKINTLYSNRLLNGI